jgi:hypothetical protein
MQDNFVLLDTFSMVLIKNKPLKLKIAEDIILIFELIDDKNNKKTSFSTELVDKITLKFKLENFNNPLGASTAEPLLIGDYKGKKLYIHISVYAIGDNDLDKTKTFVCSLFQEQ